MAQNKFITAETEQTFADGVRRIVGKMFEGDFTNIDNEIKNLQDQIDTLSGGINVEELQKQIDAINKLVQDSDANGIIDALDKLQNDLNTQLEDYAKKSDIPDVSKFVTTDALDAVQSQVTKNATDVTTIQSALAQTIDIATVDADGQ